MNSSPSSKRLNLLGKPKQSDDYQTKRSQTPVSKSAGIGSNYMSRKIPEIFISGWNSQTKESSTTQEENSWINKHIREGGEGIVSGKLQDGVFEMNKIISYLKVCAKNNFESGKKILEFYTKGIKPNEIILKNYKDTQAVFESHLNELSAIIHQLNSSTQAQVSSVNSLLNKGSLIIKSKINCLLEDQSPRTSKPTKISNFASTWSDGFKRRVDLQENELFNLL